MNTAQSSRKRKTEAGVALLAVMCTVTIMILVALAFSNSVQLETRTAIDLKEAAQAQAMAEGGVEVAILELAYPPGLGDSKPRPWPWKTGTNETEVPYEGGKALVQIVNEAGKVDLNGAGREQLRRLFEARGVEAGAASQLAAAIIHWRSPAAPEDRESEDLDNYYRAAGYHATHDRFRSVEEVLRVRGMNREIFYGTAEIDREGAVHAKYGVGQDLTTYSGSPQINVNYASEAVLRSLPGINEGLAQAIVEERGNGPFQSLDDLGQRLAVSLSDQALPFLTTSTSNTYSIVAAGSVSGSRVRRTVRAVVQIAAQGAARHRIIAWYDDAS